MIRYSGLPSSVGLTSIFRSRPREMKTLPSKLKVALLTTDGREVMKDYDTLAPHFGTAPEALMQGLAELPEVEVHVVSCLRKPVASPPTLAPNIFFHSLHVPKIGWMRTGYQGCIRAVQKKLRAIQPDIVHGQGTELDCALTAVFSGFPNVVTIHGNAAELARLFRAHIGSFFWLAGRLEDFTLKRTSGVFCNSAYTEQLVRQRTPRTWRVPNALRKEFLCPFGERVPDRQCTLVNVGVLSPRKRQLELLEVLRALRGEGLELSFQFIGQPTPGAAYTAAFLAQIAPMEKEGFARYLGWQSTRDLVGLFDRANALVHFSPTESFGLVIAEALARDLKLFAARVGGVPEIAEGVPGAELFDGNDWTGLTSAIGKWHRCGSPRAAGAASVMRARYDPVVIARRHVEIYREVLAEVAC
jgi:glycosyltransferase involved in cell wall biosynthesis